MFKLLVVMAFCILSNCAHTITPTAPSQALQGVAWEYIPQNGSIDTIYMAFDSDSFTCVFGYTGNYTTTMGLFYVVDDTLSLSIPNSGYAFFKMQLNINTLYLTYLGGTNLFGESAYWKAYPLVFKNY